LDKCPDNGTAKKSSHYDFSVGAAASPAAAAAGSSPDII